MRVEYREEACRSALNRVKGMPFAWSLNPYTGCAHRCTFCYVRAFEQRADRPSDDRYGRSIRVKTNVAEVLARSSRGPRGEGARRDRRRHRPIPAGRGALPADARLHRGARPRGDAVLDHHPRPADRPRRRRAPGGASGDEVSVSFSIPTLDRRRLANDRTRHGAAAPAVAGPATLVDAGIDAGVGMAPILPGLSDRPEQLAEVVQAARDAGATFIWANLLYLSPGRASTSSTTSRVTGRSSSSATRTSTRARLPASARSRPRARACAGLARDARRPRPPRRRLGPRRSRCS